MFAVDTSVVVAAAMADDRRHRDCNRVLSSTAGPVVLPILAVAEAGYLLTRDIGGRAARAFIRSIELGEFLVEKVDAADWPRIGELLEEYSDLGLGVTDASIVAMCERLEISNLATLDRRYFPAVKPRHCEAFTLLP